MLTYISNTDQSKASAFADEVREALALDWYSRYKRPLCGGGQREKAVSGSHCPAHQARSGS